MFPSIHFVDGTFVNHFKSKFSYLRFSMKLNMLELRTASRSEISASGTRKKLAAVVAEYQRPTILVDGPLSMEQEAIIVPVNQVLGKVKMNAL